MVQYVLTALAGLVIGIAGMRVWQIRQAAMARAGGNAGEVGEDVEDEAGSEPDVEAAAPAMASGLSRKVGRNLLLIAAVVAAGATALLVFRPKPDATGATPSALPAMTGAADDRIGDVDTMIRKLADRLKANPEDGEGFRMLGWSYVMTGHPEKAIEPYKRALALLPGNPVVHTGYGEALAAIAGGTVTEDAKKQFARALAINPEEPRARYFTALWKAQHGNGKQALDEWIALANSGPDDAPWQADVRRQIGATARKLGTDVSARLRNPDLSASQPRSLPKMSPVDDLATGAARSMFPGDRQDMIDGMVDRLARRLQDDPRDAEGWVKLLRSRMVLEQVGQAGKDLVKARKALASDKAGLGRVNDAASALGVPGA